MTLYRLNPDFFEEDKMYYINISFHWVEKKESGQWNTHKSYFQLNPKKEHLEIPALLVEQNVLGFSYTTGLEVFDVFLWTVDGVPKHGYFTYNGAILKNGGYFPRSWPIAGVPILIET